jgi:hypothetical protein
MVVVVVSAMGDTRWQSMNWNRSFVKSIVSLGLQLWWCIEIIDQLHMCPWFKWWHECGWYFLVFLFICHPLISSRWSVDGQPVFTAVMMRKMKSSDTFVSNNHNCKDCTYWWGFDKMVLPNPGGTSKSCFLNTDSKNCISMLISIMRQEFFWSLETCRWSLIQSSPFYHLTSLLLSLLRYHCFCTYLSLPTTFEMQEVCYRKVLEDDGNRQLVEVEQLGRWRFLMFSGTFSSRVMVEQNRQEHQVTYLFSTCRWYMILLLASICHTC